MVGMAAMTAGLAAMAAIGDGSSLVFIGLALGAVGAGMGVSLPGLVSSVANSVSEKDFGAIAAVQSMVTMVGMVLGMQGLQTIHAVRVRSVGGAVAYRDAFLFAAGVSAVAAALSLAVRSMHRAQAVPPEESPEAPMIPAPVSDTD
jgi:MFS family permease